MDGPMFKLARDKARKQSIFFSTSIGWNENSLSHRIKDLSPSRGSLFEAAWNGEVGVIEEILNQNPDDISTSINIRDTNGCTPLHLGFFSFFSA